MAFKVLRNIEQLSLRALLTCQTQPTQAPEAATTALNAILALVQSYMTVTVEVTDADNNFPIRPE
jgi:hypothetical protein